MGGAGVMQFASGPTFAALAETRTEAEAYGALFGLIGLAILVGLAIYSRAEDRTG
jgi:hypothetical protein